MPPGICNTLAATVKPEGLNMWNLANTTKNICYRMFADQAEMTDHGRQYFGRNWCWVLMKHYGCLTHLDDAYTWEQAQAKASSLGGVPSKSVSPFEPLQDAHVCDHPRAKESRNWTSEEWSNATQWFKDNVVVYVLNLPSQVERWHNISTRLQELKISAEKVAGFNMSFPKDLEDAYSEGAIPKGFNVTHAQEEASSPGNGMGGITGTVGCAAGHFRALARASSASIDKPIALILEDDAFPDADFVPQVWALVQQELPCDWDAVSLGSRCPYGKCVSHRLSRVLPDENEPEWRCRHGVNYGFQGVLYRKAALEGLQRKWQPVVFDENRPHCLDVDVALASISDQVAFYAVPSIQALLTEQQDEGGSVRMKINGGSL